MSRSRKSAGGTVLTVISLLLAFFMLFPIIWSFFCSIQSESKQFAVIWDWFKPPYTLANYRYILSGTSVFRWFINSLVTSVLSTVITVLISTMAAYAIAKIRFRAAKALYYYIMVGLLVPTEATIVPLFIEVNKMNLINTYAGLILPGVAGRSGSTGAANLRFSVPLSFRSRGRLLQRSRFCRSSVRGTITCGRCCACSPMICIHCR